MQIIHSVCMCVRVQSPVSAEMESGKPSTAPVSFRNDSGLSSASASSQGGVCVCVCVCVCEHPY